MSMPAQSARSGAARATAGRLDETRGAPHPAIAGDLACVQDVVRRSGTSFYWAMRALPEKKRHAMFAVYAFCREVDDIADEPGETADKLARLGEWRIEIDRLFGGTPQRPVSRVLAAAVDRYALRRQDLLAIIDGMEMDAPPRVRIADWTELEIYCDRVACAVGRLSTPIFGADASLGLRLANALGQALQLTNILRDLVEDAGRNRLYLPLDALTAEGGADAEEATTVLAHPAVPSVCAEVARVADDRFREADAILADCDRRSVRPALVMRDVYRLTLDRLTRRGWQRWAEPVSVPRWQKLWMALKHGVR